MSINSLNRREALQAIGILSAGIAFPACAGRVRTNVNPTARAAQRNRHLAPVNVAPERVIRTVVGLRPFRASGFLVKAEPLGDKLLVHNYGHGGGGVTLSWGTARLAVDLVSEAGKSSGTAAVIGCGAVGLATARTLQRRGFDVTIYAKDLPPDTTSNIAGASWFPSHVVDDARRTPEWNSQFERAARIAHRTYQLMIGDEYGVHWREQYNLSDSDDDDGGGGAVSDYERLRDLFPAPRMLNRSDNPFPVRYAHVDNMMYIEPSVYLTAVLRDFYIAGGRVRRIAFAEPRQLGGLPESVVVNCTGLGSRELFGDREMTPIKGQLSALIPQPEVDYAMTMGGLYMFPRRDGIMLGGTFERGVETMEPNLEAQKRIIAGHQRVFGGMR